MIDIKGICAALRASYGSNEATGRRNVPEDMMEIIDRRGTIDERIERLASSADSLKSEIERGSGSTLRAVIEQIAEKI